jgi:hypothetical protein
LVVCQETTAIKSIRLKLYGDMNIYWHDQGTKEDHAEFEDYLNEDVTVWEPKRNEKHWMFPGVHEYLFEHVLSEKLPQTMEDSA